MWCLILQYLAQPFNAASWKLRAEWGWKLSFLLQQNETFFCVKVLAEGIFKKLLTLQYQGESSEASEVLTKPLPDLASAPAFL